MDRDWEMLSEWLIRAYSLRKRQAKGYRREGMYDDEEDSSRPASAPTTGKADADAIAVEVDHYTVLGVTVDATEKQLKTAYRMRSLQFHPDRKEGHTAAFQRIAEAYETLSDADKRSAYDMGGDIKVKRGRRDEDDDSEEEDEEHKTSMREEVEREFYPERYQFWPFGESIVELLCFVQCLANPYTIKVILLQKSASEKLKNGLGRESPHGMTIFNLIRWCDCACLCWIIR